MTRLRALGPLLVAVAVLTAAACKPAPDPLAIDVVGDSITVQSFWGRDAAWLLDGPGAPPGSNVEKDAWLGYRFEDVLERQAARVQDRATGVLVIALGTNNASAAFGGDGWTSSDEDAFRALLNAPHPDACVVVSLPYAGPAAPALTIWHTAIMRARLAAIAGERPGTVLVDWGAVALAHPGYIRYDGVHLADDERVPANLDAASAFGAHLWEGVAACP